ncbi:unnamed protein product [Bemisia tabaci]|uniref:Uncharacterized protein n=1 Tax=Bemisia tabaci TaxID=7038 RepID=A0A9P0F5E8_BEMTA|nr:unnamed protein product [Bemisia tabaci]
MNQNYPFKATLSLLLEQLGLNSIYAIVTKRGTRVPIVVVGNKAELHYRAVPKELAETTAEYDWDCGYVECSAKENQNIVQVFKELLAQAKVSA